MTNDLDAFEEHRPALLTLAYRMLGDVARSEDIVQDAWIRWQCRGSAAQTPKAFLLTTVARLCLDELGSSRARREESRSDRLPEPVDLGESPFGRVDVLDRISIAFLVLLQRLTPAERAVLILHDVFDMSHIEIGDILGKSDVASRQLLKSARDHVAVERRAFEATDEEHTRLLRAFVQAITRGDHSALFDVLADDAVLVVDPGRSERRFGKLRRVGRPVIGRERVAALVAAFLSQPGADQINYVERTLNGKAATVAFLHGKPIAAVFVSVAEGKVQRVFFQADATRLQHLGRSN